MFFAFYKLAIVAGVQKKQLIFKDFLLPKIKYNVTFDKKNKVVKPPD